MQEKKHYALRTIPGYSASRGGIQVGATISADAADTELELLEQLGIEWVMVNVNDRSMHSVDSYRAIVDRVARYGLSVYRIANHSVHNMEEVTLALPGRDEKIDEFIGFLEDIAKVGVRYHTYAHMANGIWSSEARKGRGGSLARSWDPADAVGKWNGREWKGDLTHGRLFSEEELWANYEYFIRRIAPVTETLGIRIGIHPDDPPVAAVGGIPRCIFGSFDGYRRAIEITDSPNIGVCLCVGCWLEGGEAMGASVAETIEYFAGIGKLFKVHFRNVSNPMPNAWVETLPDEGYADMYGIMRALAKAGFDGCVIPDHIPRTAGGREAGLAYSLGYMKALAQAVSSGVR